MREMKSNQAGKQEKRKSVLKLERVPKYSSGEPMHCVEHETTVSKIAKIEFNKGLKMTNQNNVDLDDIFNKYDSENEDAVLQCSNRQFYGQDGQLPNRWDFLTRSVVFLGIFIFFSTSNVETANSTTTEPIQEVAAEEKA